MIAWDRAHHDWLNAHAHSLLQFAAASQVDDGFGWLDDNGRVDVARGVELWITCRMTHCHALAVLAGDEQARRGLDHGVAALLGPLRDAEYGGWYARRGGREGDDDHKLFYAHAFVVLAASSAVAAGHQDGAALLDHALAVMQEHFLEPGVGLGRESFTRDWSQGEDYRGVNANMHAVEALLAAADVTGRDDLRVHALTIATRVIDGFAREHHWLLPEHYSADWTALPDYNLAQPAHPFRPYGVTIGHLCEWARLVLDVEAASVAAGDTRAAWALECAEQLYATAVKLGWAPDGHPGFVYTVAPDGEPVVRERMHWVVAEAIGAAAALWHRTGSERYAQDYAAWWDYARTWLIDPERGSWHHELSPAGGPSRTVWDGKPDIYHAYQATLFGRAPLHPSLASALRAGLAT